MGANKNQRLYLKLLGIFLSLIAVGIALTSILNYTNSKKLISQMMETDAKEQVEDSTEQLRLWLDSVRQELQTIAASPTLQSMDWEAQKGYLKRIVAERDYESLVVIDQEGILQSTNGTRINVSERDYFQKAKKGEIVISDPVVSGADRSRKIIMVAVPIKDSAGKVLGVLSTDLSTDYLNAQMKDLTLFDHGYGYLVNNEGTILAHPNPEFVLAKNINRDFGPELAKIGQQIAQKKAGSALYDFEKEEVFISYHPIENSDWVLALRAPYRTIMQPLNQQRNIAFFVSLAILVLCSLVVYAVSRKITKPIEDLNELTKLMALGELSITATIDRRDEIGALGENFNRMVKGLREMIQGIMQVVHNLEGASEQVAAGTGEAGAAIEEVASSANEFASSAEEIEASIESITATAQNVSGEATEGSETMETAGKQIQSIETTTNTLSEAMATLQNRSDEIGNIVEAISKVAEQTNLLALNAAIEAARAGEQGRGFAVVAGEIRELAQNTQNEAARISELVDNIQREIREAQENMDTNVVEVQKGVVAIESSQVAFEKIKNSISSLAEELKLLGGSSVHISQGSEQIAASTEEQTASIEEIAASADELKNTAQRLAKLGDQFKL